MSQPSIKKNYIYKLFFQLLSLLTPLITAPYISRVLGVEAIGKYSYSLSIISYFTMVAVLGTPTYGIKEIAQTRDDKDLLSKTFWEIELMSILTSVIALIGWLILISISDLYRPFFIALTPLLFSSMIDISWFYIGIEKIHYTVSVNVICKVVGLILLFLFIKDKNDVILYVFINSFISMIGNCTMWLYIHREITFVGLKSLRVKRHFRQTFKYFITSVAISIYTVFDKTMLGYLTKNAYQSGYYEQADKIVNIIKPLAFSSINDVMIPRMSYLFANNNISEIKGRIKQSIGVELFFTIGSVFGLIAIAKNFVPIFLGNGYEPVVPLLQLMSLILIPICFSTCIGTHYYVPSGNVLKGTKLTICGSVVNLIVNVPLIMLYKSVGAVISSILAEFIIAILYVYNARNYIDLVFVFKELARKSIAGLLMFCCVSVISLFLKLGTIFSLILQITIGGSFYIMVLLFLKDDSAISLVNVFLMKVKKFLHRDRAI